MNKENQMELIRWLSILTMLIGLILIIFGIGQYVIVGAILFGFGLGTRGLIAIGSKDEEKNVDDKEDNLNPEKKYEKEVKLRNGKVLQIVKDIGYSGETKVKINDKNVEDGFYFLANQDEAYEIKRGKIKMEYYIEKFKQEDGSEIEIGGRRTNGIGLNCPVWKNGILVPNGEYKKGRKKISVSDGVIINKN